MESATGVVPDFAGPSPLALSATLRNTLLSIAAIGSVMALEHGIDSGFGRMSFLGATSALLTVIASSLLAQRFRKASGIFVAPETRSEVTQRKLAAQKVGQITSPTREQSSGGDEISAALMRMNQLVPPNAGLAADAARPARTFKRHAGYLAGLVSVFPVDAARGGASSRHAAE